MDLNLGEIIRQTRKAKGLTLESLASEIGVSKGYLSLVENGLRQLSETQARKIGEALGIEDIESWTFMATKMSLIHNIQQKYPQQFNSLFHERPIKGGIYKKLLKDNTGS